MVDIHTRIIAVKGASLIAEQNVLRAAQILVRSELRLACMGENGAPMRFPPILRSALEAMQRGQLPAKTGL
jgi:acyl-CoA thioester hydrolase